MNDRRWLLRYVTSGLFGFCTGGLIGLASYHSTLLACVYGVVAVLVYFARAIFLTDYFEGRRR